jgi:hypothetical protein
MNSVPPIARTGRPKKQLYLPALPRKMYITPYPTAIAIRDVKADREEAESRWLRD